MYLIYNMEVYGKLVYDLQYDFQKRIRATKSACTKLKSLVPQVKPFNFFQLFVRKHFT
jgi:hypothetical protein